MSTVPSNPASNVNALNNFSSMYAMTRSQVNSLLTELNTSNFIDNIQLLFETPIENIISLRCYPFDTKARSPVGSTADSPIIVNVVTLETNGNFLGNITQPMISLGSLEVPKMFGNFLDYAPFTKVEMYLPYIGFVNLDTNEVMGKTLSIKYAVDYMTGMGTAFVTANDVMIYTGEGQVGVDVTLGGRNAAEIAKNNLMTGINTAGGIASTAAAIGTGGVAAGAIAGMKTLANTTASVIQGNQVHVTKGSIGSSANGFYAPQNAYLIITRPKPAEPSTYASQYGRPSGKTEQLENLTGYTVVDSVHVEGITNGTQDEITEIERLLKSGVIL